MSRSDPGPKIYQHHVDAEARATLTYLGVNRRDSERPHVCGNCRSPWQRYGREDCPNARR